MTTKFGFVVGGWEGGGYQELSVNLQALVEVEGTLAQRIRWLPEVERCARDMALQEKKGSRGIGEGRNGPAVGTEPFTAAVPTRQVSGPQLEGALPLCLGWGGFSAA